jgi:protein NUD1
VARDGAAAGGETPEWKRRLIHGEGITKDKKDLFAPMGLQNVFRPPTIGKGTVAPKSENKKTNPWSKLSADTQDRTTPDLGFSTSKRGSTMKRPEMAVLEEASEEGSVRHRSLSAPEAFDGEQDNQDPAHEFQDPSRELENPVDPAIDDPRARTVSGQEEIRNEVISPIIVSKTNTVDGTDYQAYTNSMRRLHGTLEEAATGERPRPISRLSDHGIDYGTAADALQEFSALDSQAHDWTSHSLPDDLSVGTPDIVSNDPFVNLRRGGYSRDGSFHKRNLSASSFPSSMRPSLGPHGNSSRDQLRTTDSAEASQIISRVPPTAPTPPNIPSSPPVSQKTPSSGSPLKLFGKYDTFTNDKLLKRMSQYEETFEEGSGGADDGSIKATAQHRSSARSSLQFGSDQFDDYDFDVDVSRFPTPIPRDPDETGSPKLPRNTQRREQIFHRETNGSGETRTKRVVQVSRQSSAETAHRIIQIEKISKQRVSHNDQHNPTLRQDEIHHPGEGKRAMNSPRRGEPVTKRRRTLLTDEIENLTAQLQTAATVEDRHIVTRSLAGQKRKDARYENDGRTADPDVLASRQILRPRNPTPSQAKSFIKQQISESPEFANEPEIQSLVLHLEEVETPGVDEDSKTEAVAEELASFGVGIAQMMSETRKGSITTRDFLKEATKIMDIIRAKGRPSPLDSVLEGDMKSSCSGSPSMFESTADRFSRPPSRDGVSLRKTREPKELDPRIISHLRKFEDRDESELVMDSSRASLHLEREEEQGDGEGDASVLRTGAAFESSPSNIRIRDNPNSDRKRKHSASTVPEEAAREHNDIPTHSSSGESMNRTIPTSSSTSSGLRGVIPSDKVSHLIPEQIGGMTFDRNKQRWIKDHRSSDKGTRRKGRTESSEDDPFRDIPDLSVDEMEELKRREALIKAKNGTVKEQSPGEDGPHPLRTVSTIEEESDQASSGESRPHTREGAPTIPPNTSSAPSKESRFEFSVPPPATRATSWGEEDILPKAPVQRRAVAPQPAPASHMDDVEHEIRIHEGRVSTVPNQSDRENRQPRAVTIAFSSPLVSHIGYQDDESSLDNDSLLGTKIGSPAVEQFRTSSNSVQSLVHQYEQTTRSSSSRRIHSREGIRPFSLDGHQFAARPISRIEERNEDSPERELSMIHQPSESKAVATPAHATSSNALAVVPSTKNSRNWSFHLSPLPEFTVNQVDHSLHLEVSYIAGRMQHSSVRQVHGTLSLSVEDMVKHITDVEAYEPYWEYMRQLNLRGKRLISLHRLKEFCSRLDKLDVSNNKIGQLGDVPYSVRTLNIQRNCLTDMTSWGHLTNLQYLDVSGNELETLEGFGCLMHLRELKANRNMIRSIDGILDLDGLLVLKLSGNQLTAVDFEACEL